jgi:hypothetical protein
MRFVKGDFVDSTIQLPPPQEPQLVAEQEEQLLVPAACIEPSELLKEHADINRCTSAASQSGQWTSASLRISSFSNLWSHDLQRNS